jgi:hypothetical protein
MGNRTGNLPPLLGIFPDYPAPIVRNSVEGRELAMARWGMPSRSSCARAGTATLVSPISGIPAPRIGGDSWRLKAAAWSLSRPLPRTRPCPLASGRRFGPHSMKHDHWAFFAGIWTNWTSVRKVKERKTTSDVFAFLTTEPNALVRQYQAKAMPGARERGCSKFVAMCKFWAVGATYTNPLESLFLLGIPTTVAVWHFARIYPHLSIQILSIDS